MLAVLRRRREGCERAWWNPRCRCTIYICWTAPRDTNIFLLLCEWKKKQEIDWHGCEANGSAQKSLLTRANSSSCRQRSPCIRLCRTAEWPPLIPSCRPKLPVLPRICKFAFDSSFAEWSGFYANPRFELRKKEKYLNWGKSKRRGGRLLIKSLEIRFKMLWVE